MSIDCLVDALNSLRAEAVVKEDQRLLWKITAIENIFKDELISKRRHARFAGKKSSASCAIVSSQKETIS